MLVDGCEHSFRELAAEVLPGHLDTLRAQMKHPRSMGDFGVKRVGPVTLQRRWGLNEDPSACYVLIDGGKPIYVGISRGVIQRLRNHVVGPDHMVAALAYRIAAAKYPHGKTATEAIQDAEFNMRFQESRDYLLSLNTAWVEIHNPPMSTD